ncbi:MAG TPA: sigma-70 family RNA polymerase sigma factor [Caulobacteraceae bacterium]|nr:sigma-70 family RNA polymerase sigma factor [Caulobacteraceae bacterium]
MPASPRRAQRPALAADPELCNVVALRPRAKRVDDVERQLKDLMIRGLAGDAAAHAQMLHALAGRLRGYFGRRLGTQAVDVEDLVQETLIAVHRKGHTFDPRAPFTPWAYAIARHKLVDHFRKVGSRREAPLEAAEALWSTDDPAEQTARGDVARLLSALPERQRRLIQDVKLTGLSIEEASRASGLSVANVKVTLHRAMKALARRVRDANG